MIDKTVGLLTWEKMDNRKFNSVGSSRIRMRWLIPFWDRAEEYGIGKKYDVMIFQKVYWGKMMDAFEGVKILDLCDPDWLENKPVFEFIDKVDAVTTSTQALADYILKLRPNALVRCIPDRVLMEEAKPIKEDYGDKLKTVVWFGYAHNFHYVHPCLDELIKNELELVVVSESEVNIPLTYRNQLKVTNVPFNYKEVNKEMIKYDAVLLPIPEGDERGKFKSNNKTLQAWALGMPVISKWQDIEAFQTAEARKAEGQKRRKEIEEQWKVELSVKEYEDLIEEIKARKQ